MLGTFCSCLQFNGDISEKHSHKFVFIGGAWLLSTNLKLGRAGSVIVLYFSHSFIIFPSTPPHLKTDQGKTIQIGLFVQDYTRSHYRDSASLQGYLSITKGFMVLICVVVVFRIQDVIGVLPHHPW